MNYMKNFFIVTLTLFYTHETVIACTGIFLKSANDGYVYARTLEFGVDTLQSNVLFVPRNYVLKADGPTGQRDGGMQWKSRYAVLGINAYDLVGFLDGVNEKGLAGGLFLFPRFAQYQEVQKADYKNSLPVWSLLTKILTTCATVEDVKNMMPTLHVSISYFAPFKAILPVHCIVHDSAGNSLVIEYIKGVLHMHENPLGVITNSPSFDWHMTNLANYINLQPGNVSERTLINSKDKKATVSVTQLGMGSGMLGIPGDMTPPSRFVRAVFMTQTAPVLATEDDVVHQAFHILNNFDIPKGFVIDKAGDLDSTLWTSAIDMRHKVLYFRTYDNFQIVKVAMESMKLDDTTIKTFSMKNPAKFIEIA